MYSGPEKLHKLNKPNNPISPPEAFPFLAMIKRRGKIFMTYLQSVPFAYLSHPSP
jgi:hypothetical protein